MRTVLVTGSAGFIGFHLARRLLADGHRVIGFDNMNAYYDPALKQARVERLTRSNYTHVTAALETPGALRAVIAEHRPDLVVHLAAQAGVRYSIEDPRSYVDSNLIGTFELLEAARAHPPRHMLLASTSSAYGANTEMPYVETQKADHQMSFYAATKKATEAMAHSYAHLYNLPVSMFRFFTVYGPWGRPDMALFKFTRAMLKGDAIDIYNHGKMRRDFTYIDDLIDGIVRLGDAVPQTGAPVAGDSLSPVAPFRVVNIGTGRAVPLMEFVSALEDALGVEAKKNFMDMQAGDVPATWADNALLRQLVGEIPVTPLRDGVGNFVEWYQQYRANG